MSCVMKKDARLIRFRRRSADTRRENEKSRREPAIVLTQGGTCDANATAVIGYVTPTLLRAASSACRRASLACFRCRYSAWQCPRRLPLRDTRSWRRRRWGVVDYWAKARRRTSKDQARAMEFAFMMCVL